MWRKICTKEFWANIFAYVLLLAVASAIVHSTFRSWEKDQEMRGYLVQAEELAQELLVSGCEFGLELRLQLEQVWLDRPSSPFDEQMQIGIVLCQGNDELKPPEPFDVDPRHYIGLGKQEGEIYLVLWDRDGKIKLKRKLRS